MDFKGLLKNIMGESLSRDDALDALTELLQRYSFIRSVLSYHYGKRTVRAVVLADPGAPPRLFVEIIGYGDSMMPLCVETTVEIATPAVNTIDTLRFEKDRLLFVIDGEAYWWVTATPYKIDEKAKKFLD